MAGEWVFWALLSAGFAAATAVLANAGSYGLDPDLELARYLSVDRSPQNPSRATDRTLDALYDRQRALTDVAARAAIVREFERRAFTEATQVPVLWFHRINVLSSRIRNWQITSNAILGLDMTDVWLAE